MSFNRGFRASSFYKIFSLQNLILCDTTVICYLCWEASLSASREEQREEWRATAGKYISLFVQTVFKLVGIYWLCRRNIREARRRNICFGVFWRHISGAIYETVSRRLIVKAPSATLYAPFDGGLFRSQELVCVALLLHRSVTASTCLSCAFKPNVLCLTAEISCDFDHRLVLFVLTAQIWRVVIKLLFVCLNVMIYKA